MSDRERIENADAESRAGSILLSLFGYGVFTRLPVGVMERLVSYVAEELRIVAEDQFSTMPVAEDCREMTPEETGAAIPPMVTWQQLREGGGLA